MNKIEFFTQTKIWLSLEDFTNAGLKQDDIIDIINQTSDPYTWDSKLTAEKMGINNNVIITSFCSSEGAVYLVEKIKQILEEELNKVKI